MKIVTKIPSKKEEIGNFITHTAGTLLALAGLVVLIIRSVKIGGTLRIFSFTLFGITLVLLYVASSLYHGLPLIISSKRLQKILRIFDHSAIFLLIAGTYSPFALVTLNSSTGLKIFVSVWLIAIIGIVIKILFISRFPVFFTALYIFMGWLVVFAFKPLIQNLPLGGIVLLFAGGIAYTLGVVFYAVQKMKYNHFIWHFFVLAGSILHYFSVLLFV